MIRQLPRWTLKLLVLGIIVWAIGKGVARRLGPIDVRPRPGAIPERSAGVRVPVDPAWVWIDDGDTVRIDWPDAPRETVRLLGIDAPEIKHRSNPWSVDQPFGPESLAFARRRILGAGRLELLRSPAHDRFGRTLGYLFADGINYSVLAVQSHLAEATIDRFGDSGLPAEAAEVQAAARGAGSPPFESPKIIPGPTQRNHQPPQPRCEVPLAPAP